MTLTEKAYLVVDDGTNTAVFEFEIGLEHSSQLEKRFMMGERGQYIREIVNEAPVINELDEAGDRRTGYWVDGGSGNWQIAFQFETGLEDVTWGDGSGGTGPNNVTQFDASGKDVKPIQRLNVLENWLAKTITDSRNPGRFYWGEWTDGQFQGTPGAMGAPMPVAVNSHSLETDTSESASLTGTITVSHITIFPDLEPPDWLSGSVTDFFGEIQNVLADIPDA